jgi:Na+/H+ antiporter NhaD/arsenite permease-like protein
MNLAVLSLGALAVSVVVSFTARLNVGVLAIAFAWLVGVVIGGMNFKDVAIGFPTELFLMLAGVMLLFSHAQANGTLDRIAHYAVRGCRGNVGLIPIMFFMVAVVLASIGPGNIAMAALLGPMAMRVAGKAGISPFLMTIMVGNGANAGSLSPIAPTGIIINGLLARIGITGVAWPTYLNVLLAHTAVAFAGYFLFGGLKLFSRTYLEKPVTGEEKLAFERRHWVTALVIAALIIAVIFFKINVGMGAFAAVVILSVFRVTADTDAIRQMPWGPILMVCGVTVLIALVEKTQGIDLFTALLARFSSRQTVTGMIAFVTGIISVYSSTSGVVLPAFIPTVPGLAERLGADVLPIVYSICVGAHLVDVSPLSTTGALCIAAAPIGEDYRLLFNKLLAWGLSMSVVGSLASYLFFGVLRGA